MLRCADAFQCWEKKTPSCDAERMTEGHTFSMCDDLDVKQSLTDTVGRASVQFVFVPHDWSSVEMTVQAVGGGEERGVGGVTVGSVTLVSDHHALSFNRENINRKSSVCPRLCACACTKFSKTS